MDLGLAPQQPVLRGYIADRAVQPHRVVTIHLGLDQAPGIVRRQRCQRPNALLFQRLVPAFDFSVGMSSQMRRIETIRSDVSE